MKILFIISAAVCIAACSRAGSPDDISESPVSEISVAMIAVDAKGLEPFLGSWQSGKTVFGQEADSHMHWTPALEGRFIRLDYAINPANKEAEKSIFSGVAFYKIAEGPELKAFWADTTGDLHPITAQMEDQTLTAIWGIAGQKLGKTRYELTAPDVMRVTDWIMRDGEYRQFNDNEFSRVTGAPKN